MAQIIKIQQIIMKESDQIKQIVIVGGGPVGNLSAVLSGLMGVKTTVYEKRDTYTREINLKIQLDLFQEISKVFQRIIRKKDDFFQKMHSMLVEKDGKILLNFLEKALKEKAESLGVKYIIKEIKTFKEVMALHQKNSPLVLDCTGRNSFLRVNQFGPDTQNMEIHNLHHALHMNFDTVIPRDFDYRLIYSIITNSDDLKLGDIVVSKGKGGKQKQGKAVHVTIPLFISDKLSKVFDQNFPHINRNPLKPFSYRKQDFILQEDVENLLYSIFCPFLMQDWQVDWNTVAVKKINITCGFAVNRSRGRYICLGDSAAHFAYFKSLNFGLKHSFQLMKILASFHGLKCQLGEFHPLEYIDICRSDYPPLLIKQARLGPSPSQYLIKTQAIIYSAMVFNVAESSLKKLDILPVFCQPRVERLWNQYIEECKSESFDKSLKKFQKIRDGDIDSMILSNRAKRNGTQVVSYLVWLDGLNPLKFSDVLDLATKGYALDKKDFDYFAGTFKKLKGSMQNPQAFKIQLGKSSAQIQKMVSSSIAKEFFEITKKMAKISESSQFNSNQFVKASKQIKWQRTNYDYKRGTIYIKTLQLIAKIFELASLNQNK